MRQLFTSFSELLWHLRQGTVSKTDLHTGLFFFCFNAQRTSKMRARSKDDPTAPAHRQLVAAIKKAEKDGRLAWVELEPTNARLNILLARNGHEAIPLDGDFPTRDLDRRLRKVGIDRLKSAFKSQ